MPELPEMENYKKLLNQRILGKVISDIEVNREKSINVSSSLLKRELVGRQILEIDRRAKHLIFKLDSGKNLLLHLMLGGWMYVGNDKDNPNRTKQIIITFGDTKLYFIGLRLGYLHFIDNKALEQRLGDLGPEPLEQAFTYEVFERLFRNRKGKLKPLLLNQRFISGIGNCYSDEICFEAKIRPTIAVSSINNYNLSSIYNSMKTVLQNAISLGGYMDSPLYSGDTLTGGYNNHMLVYDRQGENCKRCGGTILQIELSSRKCFYCPDCQFQ